MTKKKGHRKFWEIDEHFFGKYRNFFENRLKKGVEKFRAKFGPPRLRSSGSASDSSLIALKVHAW